MNKLAKTMTHISLFKRQPLIDKLSRKTAMVGGGLGIGCTLILIGVLYASHAASEAKGVRYFIIALIEIYVILFASKFAPRWLCLALLRTSPDSCFPSYLGHVHTFVHLRAVYACSESCCELFRRSCESSRQLHGGAHCVGPPSSAHVVQL